MALCVRSDNLETKVPRLNVDKTIKNKTKVKNRAPIHFPAIINFTLLGFMRRLNGRKTQSCRSIAIRDKVTQLTTAQRKLLDTAI